MDIPGPSGGSEGQQDLGGTRWEGYSNYENVSYRFAASVDKALEAFARIDAAHSEGADVPPLIAAEARGRILTAMMKVMTEMERDQENVELYEEILGKWTGERGYNARLSQTSLREESPAWLFDMMMDLRKAAWELGYLKSGRAAKEEDPDPIEGDARSMFTS